MFSKNLKYLRKKFDMDQSKLADKLGKKSTGSISDWEAGRYTPKVGTLADIANIFNVNIDDMMQKDLSKNDDPYNISGVYSSLNMTNKKKLYDIAVKMLSEQK